jgi:hypothetical protein
VGAGGDEREQISSIPTHVTGSVVRYSLGLVNHIARVTRGSQNSRKSVMESSSSGRIAC